MANNTTFIVKYLLVWQFIYSFEFLKYLTKKRGNIFVTKQAYKFNRFFKLILKE